MPNIDHTTPIPKEHPLHIEYDNLKAEMKGQVCHTPRDMHQLGDLERIVVLGERDPRLLPIPFQAQLWRELAEEVVREIRDNHPCPEDLLCGSCTCNNFDRAIDELQNASSPKYSLLSYFKGSPSMGEFNEIIRMASELSTDQ